jgi:hypothetical protein
MREAVQAVWSVLCVVVWEGLADQWDPQAQEQVLSAWHYATLEDVSHRSLVAREPTQSLWEIVSSLLQEA